MADALKEATWVMNAKHEAKVANAAAKEMARHCDRRIALAVKSLRKIRKIANGGGNARVLTDKIFWEAEDAIKALTIPPVVTTTLVSSQVRAQGE